MSAFFSILAEMYDSRLIEIKATSQRILNECLGLVARVDMKKTKTLRTRAWTS